MIKTFRLRLFANRKQGDEKKRPDCTRIEPLIKRILFLMRRIKNNVYDDSASTAFLLKSVKNFNLTRRLTARYREELYDFI